MLQGANKSIEFESIRENINKAERFIEEICDIYNIFNNYYGNIMLAVTEAVENAIVHGNNYDSNKRVRIEFESARTGLLFRVSDQGDGFDPAQVPDPTTDESGKVGRGLYLMRKLSDEIRFNDNGRTIELVFEIASINQQTAIDRRKSLKQYMEGENVRLNNDLNIKHEKG